MVNCVVIGAGVRGNAYARHSLNSDDFSIVGVCEPDVTRRKLFSEKYSISLDMQFSDYDSFFKKGKLADAVFICTQDRDHVKPFLEATHLDYHIFLEKPIGATQKEIDLIYAAAKNYSSVIAVAHVLRYTHYFKKLKELITSGTIGDVCQIVATEDIAYWHFAHSYVRGNWRNDCVATPLSLAKTCHDFDILNWLIDSDPVAVQSFGSLSFFKKSKAPSNATDRCVDCPLIKSCAYSAYNIYPGLDSWPVTAITDVVTPSSINEALEKGPYGRCVFYCDNNIPDHQVVNLNYSSDVTAQLSISALTPEVSRSIRVMGSYGEISGNFKKQQLLVSRFGSEPEIIAFDAPKRGHGGGDKLSILDFISTIISGKSSLTSIKEIYLSHKIALLAEKSRLNAGKTLSL